MAENINIELGSTKDTEINRANQVSKRDSDFKSQAISIVDIDGAILSYLEKINLSVVSNGIKQSVPIIYGSPERWQQAKKNGYLKDDKGKVQLPLIMFKRNNLTADGNITRRFNKNERISYSTGYSNKNRFDKFSQQVGLKPTEELYKVRVGDHVQMDYDFIIWTDFVSHNNQIIEQLNWNSNEYWGEDGKRKFQSTIDSFSTTIDVAQGTDRIVRSTFTLNVKGYLLPDNVEDSEMDEMVKKEYTTQKVVVMTEIETGLSDITSLDELDAAISKD